MAVMVDVDVAATRSLHAASREQRDQGARLYRVTATTRSGAFCINFDALGVGSVTDPSGVTMLRSSADGSVVQMDKGVVVRHWSKDEADASDETITVRVDDNLQAAFILASRRVSVTLDCDGVHHTFVQGQNA
jgi:hypothetical protein